MLTPKSEEELAEAIASATGPLKVQGGGTRPIGMPVEGEVLSTVAGEGGFDLADRPAVGRWIERCQAEL